MPNWAHMNMLRRGVRASLSGGGGGGNPATDQSMLFVSPAPDTDDLYVNIVNSDARAESTATSQTTFRWGETTGSANSGKKIFEFVLTTYDATALFIACGIGPVSEARGTGYAGQNYGSALLMWPGNCRHYENASETAYVTIASGFTNPASSDIYTCAIDLDANTVSWYQNGNQFITDAAFDRKPADGDGNYVPYIKIYNATSAGSIQWDIPSTINYPVTDYTVF